MHIPTCTHTHPFPFPLAKGPTDAAPIASASISALVRERLPLNVSVQSLFHRTHSSPALLALSAGRQQASLPAHGHPPAPRVLAEAADGEPGVPQAPQQDVPTGFPRKSDHGAGHSISLRAYKSQPADACADCHPPMQSHPAAQAPSYPRRVMDTDTHIPAHANPFPHVPSSTHFPHHAHLFSRVTPTHAHPRAAVQIPRPAHSFARPCTYLTFLFRMGGGGKPPGVQQVLEPLLVEVHMLINNELAFALGLAFRFLDYRASARVGAKTQGPVYKRASMCPAAQERSGLHRYNSQVSAGAFRSGVPVQGEGGGKESLHLPACSVQSIKQTQPEQYTINIHGPLRE